MNANELAELADEFLYRYADSGGNFKDPFLKAVYIQLCGCRNAIKALKAKTLTDEEIEQLQAEHTEKGHFADTLNVKEFARAILRKAQKE